MDVINALIASLSQKEGSPSFGDMALKAFNQTTAGKALNAYNQPDSTMSSVYDAAQPAGGGGRPMQAPALQQGVVGMQQPAYTQNEYLGGIPSLLQSYGRPSQGLLPYISSR